LILASFAFYPVAVDGVSAFDRQTNLCRCRRHKKEPKFGYLFERGYHGRGGPLRSEPSDGPLYGLEVLRFGVAFVVVVWHYPYFLGVGDGGHPQQLPFHEVLTVFYTAGWYAVPWFWTLSGYIFFRNYETYIAQGAVSATQFGLLRFSRLYPLHLLTLLLVVFLQVAYASRYGSPWRFGESFDWEMFIAQLLFASNWFTMTYSFNAPIWSISIEVLVYAVFFALARSAALRTPPKTAGTVLVFLLGYSIANRTLPDGTSLEWLLACGGCFFLGGMLVKSRGTIRSTYILVLALALGSAALIVLSPNYAWMFALPALGVLLFSTGAVWQHRYVRKVARLGNLTYASYLLQFPIALAIVLALRYAHVPLEVMLSRSLFLAYLVGLFGISHLSFKYFERPAQTLIRSSMLLGERGPLAALK
jgi:peptidoglycan/LPS O-acetylase OafA/YrhL